MSEAPPAPTPTAARRTTDPRLQPVRTALRHLVEGAWTNLERTGVLPELSPGERPTVEIDRPAKSVYGDYATNLALRLARPYRRSPLELARLLADELARGFGPSAEGQLSLLGSVEVAPPGFVNLRLAPEAVAERLTAVLERPDAWGRVPAKRPLRIDVEFVSANPTGPLHIGNARGAFVGDLLCRVLEAGGHQVTREYYFNDFGTQVRNLGASVIAVRLRQPIPEDGYHGDYVVDLAATIPDEVWAAAHTGDEDPAWVVGRWASERVRAGIEASLAGLGVHFDVWKTESSLHTEGWVGRAIELLRERGHLYEEGGALWFRSTTFGDDKDRVVIRSNGEPTYFAADIGYLLEKSSRGFDHLIYIWGADHHGTVARVRGAAEAMGFDRERVEMLLTGWVRFVRDGVEVSMSKRAGTFVTLDDLLAEVGVDAARWFFGSRGANVDIDFDIELAKRQSAENPVYYVQYAHARIASILRKAAEAGLEAAARLEGLPGEGPELELGKALLRFPEVVEDAAAAHETQGITTFATELATTFHAFYRDARVVDLAEPERSRRRLALCLATKTTLANALGLLGISAPESM